MTTLDSYSTITRALSMHEGWAPTNLKLSYNIADPAAVELQLSGQSWHVARERLAAGLEARSLLECERDDNDSAADVICLSLGITGRSVLALRNPAGRRVVSINTDALRRFLEATYRICSCWREQELLAAGLDTQLGLLAATQEGRQS